jgi:hypothetical protein
MAGAADEWLVWLDGIVQSAQTYPTRQRGTQTASALSLARASGYGAMTAHGSG